MQVQDKQHSLTSCDHIAFVASSYDRDMVQSSRSSGKSSRQSDSSFYSMSHILFILVLSMLTLLSSSCLLATSLQGVDAAVTSASNHHLVRREIMNIGSPVTPQWRAFHTASLSGNYMIIYGGVANSRDAFSQPGTSDLFVYYIKDGRWYKPRMINAPTNGQRMHSAITIEDGMILFYATNFTGTDPESRNPIMMLYPSSWSWSIPKPNVSTPLSRVRQTFTYVNKRAYMYGGSTQDPNGDINTGSISNGLVEMNVESREWIDRPSGQARQGHTACYLSSSNSILVFGGVDNTFKTINQLNVYKLDDKTWDSSPVIDVDKGFPSARMGHTATCLDNKMIVFGGTPDNDGKSTVLSSNDIWVLESIDKGKKYLWSKPQMKNTNHAPPPRMGHTAVLIGNRILFWGGVSNSDDLRMYALDTDTWTWSHAEVDSMLPEPGEVSQDGEKKNDNGTVVIIVSVVCGLVGLLAIIAFILLGLRKRRARKLNNGQNSGTTIIVANGAANGTTSNGSKALLRKETLDDMSLGSQSPSSVEHPSMTEVANSGKYLNNNNGDNNDSSKRNSQNLLLIGRPVINSETNSPRDSNGDLSTAAASDPTPRVQRKGKRRVGRTTNASANTPSGIDDDDDDDDVDRWTFASSISFGQNANPNNKSRVFSNSHNNNSNNEIRPARYYPPLAALPRSRSMSQAVFRANLPAHSATPSESTSNDVTLPLTQVISPPMSPNLQPGSVISGMVSPLDQIARLRLNQMKRVGEGGDNSSNNNNNNNGDDGSGKQETAPTQNNELKPAYTTLHPDASSTTASIAAMLRDDVSENSSHKSNESPDEKIQVRGGDARESVEGYLVGTAGSRSITDPGVLHEESAEDALDGTDEDDGTGTKPALHRHPTLVRIGSDVLRPGSVLFNRYILLDRPAPNLATDAVVIYAADDTAGEMVVLKMFVSRTAWEREYVALRFLRSPQVAALRNIYNLADERTGTERYVLVTERYGRALPELLSKLDDNGDLDLNMRTGISRSIAECLSTCHAQGLVIGDLTPASFAQSNDDKPQCKLVSLERIRRPGEIWPTDAGCHTRYCAPEVAEAVRDRSELIAAATVDLWSLGCIIYEIFAEKPLFDVTASDEQVHAFLILAECGSRLGHVKWSEDRVLIPDDLNECIPDESARLAVASLLSYNPNNRLAAIEVLKSF